MHGVEINWLGQYRTCLSVTITLAVAGSKEKTEDMSNSGRDEGNPLWSVDMGTSHFVGGDEKWMRLCRLKDLYPEYSRGLQMRFGLV